MNSSSYSIFAYFAAFLISGTAVAQTPAPPLPVSFFERGEASVIADDRQGGRTISGEIYDRTQLTASHKSLGIDTMVRVTNQTTGQSVNVRVIDRLRGRAREVISLSRGAAQRIGMIEAGRGRVTLTSSLVRRPALAHRKLTPLSATAQRPLIRLTPISALAEVKPAPNLTPVSAEAARQAPAPAPQEPAPAGGYRVQFGAFAKQQNAKGLQADLQAQGIEAMVLKPSGQVLHRVVSQRTFDNSKAASKWGEQLVARNNVEQTVVTR